MSPEFIFFSLESLACYINLTMFNHVFIFFPQDIFMQFTAAIDFTWTLYRFPSSRVERIAFKVSPKSVPAQATWEQFPLRQYFVALGFNTMIMVIIKSKRSLFSPFPTAECAG